MARPPTRKYRSCAVYRAGVGQYERSPAPCGEPAVLALVPIDDVAYDTCARTTARGCGTEWPLSNKVVAIVIPCWVSVNASATIKPSSFHGRGDLVAELPPILSNGMRPNPRVAVASTATRRPLLRGALPDLSILDLVAPGAASLHDRDSYRVRSELMRD